MEKVVRNGEVAVLYSPGFGAGWYSWNTDHKELLFHPKIVELVEAGRQKEIDEEWLEENLGIKNVYCGGAYSLRIEWLPEGTHFDIHEYDGAESVTTFEHIRLIA